MSAQHTQGRLRLSASGALYVGDPKVLAGLKIHSPWIVDAWEGDDEADANMRRLAACWNACEGLSTEALERLGTLDRARVELDVIRVQAIAQRDELLAALRRAASGLESVSYQDPSIASALGVARSALARATGGAA